MQVIIDDVKRGKTNKLIDWLIAGHPIDEYPGWSRILVCAEHKEVIRVTAEVMRRTQSQLDEILSLKALSVFLIDPRYERGLRDLRKSVWSIENLAYNMRGTRLDKVDYAIDDFDQLIFQHYPKRPKLTAMTGEVYVEHTSD